MNKRGTEKNTSEYPFVKWFSELNKDSGSIAGGKGANLAEIYNLRVPVPPGFVVTAQAYDYFIEKSGIKEKMISLLSNLDYENTEELSSKTEQIKKLIVNSQLPQEMEDDIIESYTSLDAEKLNIEKGDALDILKNSNEPVFVAVRSSATTEDLADASFAGQQDSFLNIKGNSQLLTAIKKCFASLFNPRAVYYRHKKGFKHEDSKLAVVVQRMVDSTKSGVIFSRDPTLQTDDIIMEAVYGLGEGIVSGRITPDKYVISQDLEIRNIKISDKKIALTRSSSGEQKEVTLREEKSKSQVLTTYEIKKLSQNSQQLEEHYKKPQDTEFAIENEDIYLVQTRPITTLKKHEIVSEKISGEEILSGMGASPGIASGKVKIVKNLDDLAKIEEGDNLVTKMTNPDMVMAMQKSAGIITDEGGMTAHAAIVSREMGIPAVVGTSEATSLLKESMIVTLDGSTGKIYSGKTAETTKKEIRRVEIQPRTHIKVIVDLPSFAERASKTGLKSVGLTRIEGIIAESGKHPKYFIDNKKESEYEEIIFRGLDGIAKYFEEMWIRTSDVRTDEYQNLEGAPKEVEANPMLGMHGIRYSLKHPSILKAELNAMKRVSEKGKKIGILMPQLISVEELRKVKEYVKELKIDNLKIGIMIETPAAVQIIKSLCEEGIEFVSFGTNDLTQYILAIDRGNEELQDLYNEMHPAVLYQMEYVIRVAKRHNVETSICGQAGSKKEMVKYLIEKGIDSISVNADVAADIAEYAKSVEDSLVAGTDNEPRKYQPEKKEEDKIPMKSNKNPSTEEERIERDIEEIEKEKKECIEDGQCNSEEFLPPPEDESEEENLNIF